MSDLSLLLKNIVNTSCDGIMVTYPHLENFIFNRKFVKMWQIPKDILILPDDGLKLSYMIEQLENPEIFVQHLRQVKDNSSLEIWDRLKLKDGRIFRYKTHPQPQGDPIFGRVWIFRDITKIVQRELKLREKIKELTIENQRLKELSYTDELTQVANRRHFEQILNQEWQRLNRDQQPLSLILSEIDFFADYNKFYGYKAGDYCLQNIAATLSLLVQRPADLVARYSGAKFVILLPNTSAPGVITVANTMQNKIQALNIPFERSPLRGVLTMSFGLATITPNLDILPEDLTKTAEEALIQAKQEGHDCVIFKNFPEKS
jgi:diguanylate cyclase (GGDEF)-like protein